MILLFYRHYIGWAFLRDYLRITDIKNINISEGMEEKECSLSYFLLFSYLIFLSSCLFYLKEYLCCLFMLSNRFTNLIMNLIIRRHLCSLCCFSLSRHPNPKCLFCHLSDCSLRQNLRLFMRHSVYFELAESQSDSEDTFIILR